MTQEPDPYTIDWSEKTAGLVEIAREDQQWYEELVAALVRPGDRVAVDVGCGAGGMTLALATALGAPAGPVGRVLAVDAEPDLLAAVHELLVGRPEHRLARVDLLVADLGGGIEPVKAALGGPADLIWASAAIHHVGDQQATIDALAALLSPGGRLALAEGGLPVRRLPWDLGIGEPGLEVRLESADNRWFARMRAELSGYVRMPYGWGEALGRAGLEQVTTRSTLRELPTPLSPEHRAKVIGRLTRWVDRLRPTGLVDAADLAAWDRLLAPDDPAWLGHRSDLYRLDARSVHVGVRPGENVT